MHSNRPITGTEDDDERFDLDTLLHPANAFARPVDVVNDPDLTLSEKRAILASWASDACAIEAVPTLRKHQGASPSGLTTSSMRCASSIAMGMGGRSRTINESLPSVSLACSDANPQSAATTTVHHSTEMTTP